MNTSNKNKIIRRKSSSIKKPAGYKERMFHKQWGDECNKRKIIKDPKHSPRMFLWRRMLESSIYGKNYYFKALQSYKISDKSKKDIQKLKIDYQKIIDYLEEPKKDKKQKEIVYKILKKYEIQIYFEEVLKYHKVLPNNKFKLHSRKKKSSKKGILNRGNYTRNAKQYGQKNKKIINTVKDAIQSFQDTYIHAYDIKCFYDNRNVNNENNYEYTDEDYCKEKHCIQAMRANMCRNRKETKTILNGDFETCKSEINDGKINRALCRGSNEESERFLLYLGEPKNYQFRTGTNLKRKPVTINCNGKKYIIQKSTPSGARIYNMVGINSPNKFIGETIDDMRNKTHYNLPFGERTHPDFIL